MFSRIPRRTRNLLLKIFLIVTIIWCLVDIFELDSDFLISKDKQEQELEKPLLESNEQHPREDAEVIFQMLSQKI